jgi:hypothetical protein
VKPKTVRALSLVGEKRRAFSAERRERRNPFRRNAVVSERR